MIRMMLEIQLNSCKDTVIKQRLTQNACCIIQHKKISIKFKFYNHVEDRIALFRFAFVDLHCNEAQQCQCCKYQ